MSTEHSTKNMSLYDFMTRKNKSGLFKSVFIHRDGRVSIEAYNDDYDDSTKSSYGKLRSRILAALVDNIEDIENSGYFEGDDTSFEELGYREVTFYSTYYGSFEVFTLRRNEEGRYEIF